MFKNSWIHVIISSHCVKKDWVWFSYVVQPLATCTCICVSPSLWYYDKPCKALYREHIPHGKWACDIEEEWDTGSKAIHTFISLKVYAQGQPRQGLIFSLSKEREEKEAISDLPSFSIGFHLVGRGDIIAPYIVLPFPQTQNSTENSTSVDSNSHIQFHIGGFNHRTEKEDIFPSIKGSYIVMH